mmetsp:Transcript_31256/g.76255  ORF Transcript_31256/g.76255 Transcript_31256/m.76255 type:complete len:517 (-) Transcript_31256:171-1721(-)
MRPVSSGTCSMDSTCRHTTSCWCQPPNTLQRHNGSQCSAVAASLISIASAAFIVVVINDSGTRRNPHPHRLRPLGSEILRSWPIPKTISKGIVRFESLNEDQNRPNDGIPTEYELPTEHELSTINSDEPFVGEANETVFVMSTNKRSLSTGTDILVEISKKYLNGTLYPPGPVHPPSPNPKLVLVILDSSGQNDGELIRSDISSTLDQLAVAPSWRKDIQILVSECSLSTPEDIENICRWLRKTCGHVDTLINNVYTDLGGIGVVSTEQDKRGSSPSLEEYRLAQTLLNQNTYAQLSLSEVLVSLMPNCARILFIMDPCGMRYLSKNIEPGERMMPDMVLPREALKHWVEQTLFGMEKNQNSILDAPHISPNEPVFRRFPFLVEVLELSQFLLSVYAKVVYPEVATRGIYVNTLCLCTTRLNGSMHSRYPSNSNGQKSAGVHSRQVDDPAVIGSSLSTLPWNAFRSYYPELGRGLEPTGHTYVAGLRTLLQSSEVNGVLSVNQQHETPSVIQIVRK